MSTFNYNLDEAPMDEFVLLKVGSGMTTTPYDYVVCRKHSDGYKNGDWVTVKNDRLTDSHTDMVFGWKSLQELDEAPEVDKKKLGLYDKFRVERTDGKSGPGQKHHGCEYFVIDMTHDPFAFKALTMYAIDCRAEYPQLSKDILERISW